MTLYFTFEILMNYWQDFNKFEKKILKGEAKGRCFYQIKPTNIKVNLYCS